MAGSDAIDRARARRTPPAVALCPGRIGHSQGVSEVGWDGCWWCCGVLRGTPHLPLLAAAVPLQVVRAGVTAPAGGRRESRLRVHPCRTCRLGPRTAGEQGTLGSAAARAGWEGYRGKQCASGGGGASWHQERLLF